jgi:uncharacterized protein YbaP (TraB family)
MKHKLTNLEKQQLKKLFNFISKIEESKINGSDSIDDFLYEQFKVDTDEVSTLDTAREHFKLTSNANDAMFELVGLLKDHFDI